MSIVADTSPLNYLIQLQVEHVLPALCGRILVPPEVISELRMAEAPAQVRQWAGATPQWLEIKPPDQAYDTLGLDRGEAAAITLARELRADRLLIDERDGRAIAGQLGISVIGTLAVLKDAAIVGLLDLRTTVEALKRTNFRAAPRLYEQLLADYDRSRS